MFNKDDVTEPRSPDAFCAGITSSGTTDSGCIVASTQCKNPRGKKTACVAATLFTVWRSRMLLCSMFHLCAVSTAGVQFRLLKRYYPKIALKRLSAGGQLLKRYFGPLKRYFYREADSPCIP